MNMELEIKKIIESSSTDIAEGVKAKLKEDLISSITWSVREQVSKQVQDFFDAELKEEIKNALELAKPQLKEELQNAVVLIAAEAGKGLIERATSNLTSSWKVRDLAKSLFD